MLYTKNNQYPESIPDRIRLSDGSTRTGGIYTEEELSSAGYKVVSDMPAVNSDQVAEWNFTAGDWVIRNKTTFELEDSIAVQWREIRAKRNALLQECDWMQLKDYPVTSSYSKAELEEWTDYRQKLRDITKASSPEAVVWPEKPTQQKINSRWEIINSLALRATNYLKGIRP